MKKKIIIILISIIFLMFIGEFIYLKSFKDLPSKNTKSQETFNINKVVVIQDTDVTVADDFYIKQKLYDYVEELKYYELFNNHYIVISNDNQVIVINKNGKIMANGKNYMQVYNANSSENYII